MLTIICLIFPGDGDAMEKNCKHALLCPTPNIPVPFIPQPNNPACLQPL